MNAPGGVPARPARSGRRSDVWAFEPRKDTDPTTVGFCPVGRHGVLGRWWRRVLAFVLVLVLSSAALWGVVSWWAEVRADSSVRPVEFVEQRERAAERFDRWSWVERGCRHGEVR